MFFRRSKKTTKPVPTKDEDGYYYVEDGQEYNSDEFETDSDYSYGDDDEDDDHGHNDGVQHENDNVDANAAEVKGKGEGEGEGEGKADHNDNDNDNDNDVNKDKDNASSSKSQSQSQSQSQPEEEEMDEIALGLADDHHHDDKGQRVVGSLLSPSKSTLSSSSSSSFVKVDPNVQVSVQANVQEKGNVDVDVQANANANAPEIMKDGSSDQTTLNKKESQPELQPQPQQDAQDTDKPDGNIDEEGGKDNKEMDEQDQEEQDQEEQEEEQAEQAAAIIIPSLSEQRSLIALAIKRDRVDILNSILQTFNNKDGFTGAGADAGADAGDAHVQLLLNNVRTTKQEKEDNVVDDDDTEVIDQDVFIPPLHIAIASCSVQATSCLLRMGANPSIRPVIPYADDNDNDNDNDNDEHDEYGHDDREWDGPGWMDEKGDLIYMGDEGAKIELDWSIIHGVTAWELAFGFKDDENENENEDKKEGEMKGADTRQSTGTGTGTGTSTSTSSANTESSKRGWFSFSSSPSKTQQPQQQQQQPTSNNAPLAGFIQPSQLNGIKSAFTAELLRAIGSDEDARVKELVDSGMDVTEEICGKDIPSWCIEMGAVKCQAILCVHDDDDDDDDHVDDDDGMKTNTESNGEGKEPKESLSTTEKKDGDQRESHPHPQQQQQPQTQQQYPDLQYTAETLHNLQSELESNKTLINALSTSVDVMAEEVSITQGLLMQRNDSTNTALLSQVRLLKQKRAAAEDEIDMWDDRRKDCYAEYKMVMIWWKKQGGSVQEVEDEVNKIKEQMKLVVSAATSLSSSSSSSSSPSIRSITELESKTQDELIKEINLTMGEVEASRAKVDKLRKSMTYLAEDQRKNLDEIDELGLMGAVTLTGKLKDEVKEREEALVYAKEAEAEARMRVNVVRQLLERGQRGEEEAVVVKKEVKSVPDEQATETETEAEVEAEAEAEKVEEIMMARPKQMEMERVEQQQEIEAAVEESHQQAAVRESPEQRAVPSSEEEEIAPSAAVDTQGNNGEYIHNTTDQDDFKEHDLHVLLERSMDEENHHLDEDSSYVSYDEDDYDESKSSYESSDGGRYDGSDEYDSSDYSDDDDDDDDGVYFQSLERSTLPNRNHPHSEMIKGGFSDALTQYEDGIDGLFSKSRIWDLILRIVGLSKTAVKKTVRSTVEEVIPLSTNVMIV